MKHDESVSRREFTEKSAMAILSGVVISITGCGDSSSSPSPTPAPTPAPASPTGSSGDAVGVVSRNHGHVAIITQAELTAGNMLVLDIDGEAGHPHLVELSADDLAQIGNGVRVEKSASALVPSDLLYPDVEGHSHNVTFN
jgi:hypothetical protein